MACRAGYLTQNATGPDAVTLRKWELTHPVTASDPATFALKANQREPSAASSCIA
jgi:hypothetical protein